MNKEELKTFEGLYVTLRTDSSFIKGKLTRVDDDTVHLNEAQIAYKPAFHEVFTQPVQVFDWIIVNPYKIYDCYLTFDQVSKNYTIASGSPVHVHAI